MQLRALRILIIAAIAAFCPLIANAQGAEASTPSYGTVKEEPPKGVREVMAKLRIDQEKKEYQEMLDRGEAALKLSDELEASLEKNQRLTDADRAKLASLEKIVKKIRGDLGGDEDEESADSGKQETPSSLVEGFKTLKSTTVKLVDELKKTTRFSISASAIYTSNAVLRMTRLLKFWR
ncbi:MAG: hypothetical protein K1X36_01785 [Pyrinomonadaceae bacterium]|nr:hypothetical protein [Pyrinomonadaceae bacterium]